jgi:hypothetical protein
MSKKVFFLGAGFSKAIADYPLMNELSELVTDSLPTRDSMTTHFQNEVLTSLKKNFEQLLTYLSTDLPWKKVEQVYSDKALYEQITKNIHKIFWDKAWETLQQREDIYNRFESLFAFFTKHSDEIAFITLNYDLFLEIMLQYSFYKQTNSNSSKSYTLTSAKMYHYPMTWIGLRSMLTGMTFGDDNNSDIPQIIKLHGSVNWFWSGQTLAETIFYKNLEKGEYDVRIDAGLKPYIVPPVLDKNAFYNHIMIKALWKRAQELLSEATEIYIIGFSFPQTDIAVRFLFESAARNQKIYVVNKVTSNVRDKLRDNYMNILGNNYTLDFSLCKDTNVVSELGKLLQDEK